MEVVPCYFPRPDEKARVALFLSGTGSNAFKVLEAAREDDCPYEVVVLVTDAPESSRAIELGGLFSVDVVHLDIKKFYAGHGEESIKLDTPRRRELRDIWSDELWKLIEPYRADIGVLAGFVPLSNIVGRLPCLNVHPGDLTVEVNGKRIFAGLHVLPVERAILFGNRSLRSSVILAQQYQESGSKEMDSGPVLGVSPEVDVWLDASSVAELCEINSRREKGIKVDDELRRLALKNIDNLKVCGDHLVLPEVLRLFASGRYGKNRKGELCFLDKKQIWRRVETVEIAAPGEYAPRRKGGFQFKRFFKKLYRDIVLAPGTPEYIAGGWALGVTVGCIIPVFCQLAVAVPLSFVFRCSKIGAMGGTFVTTPPTAVVIYPIQCFIGSWLLGNKLSMEQISSAVSGLVKNQDFNSFMQMGTKLIAAFFAGGALFAAVLTPLAYIAVRAMIIKYRKLRNLDIHSGEKLCAAEKRG